MPIAKLIIDQRDIESVAIALRLFAKGLRGHTDASKKAQAKRLDRYSEKIRREPVVTADVLQQMDGDRLVYLPVLYVDGILTTISGQKPGDNSTVERRIAQRFARACRHNLKDKW
jgi:hypothetical protein